MVSGAMSLQANNEFSMGLFTHLDGRAYVGNDEWNRNGLAAQCLLFPPIYDLTYAAYAGAQGETQAQIEDALFISGGGSKASKLQDYGTKRAEQLAYLSSIDTGFVTENSFWGQYNYHIYDAYRNVISETLDTLIKPIDFIDDLAGANRSFADYYKATLGRASESYSIFNHKTRLSQVNLFDLSISWTESMKPQFERSGKFYYNSQIVYGGSNDFLQFIHAITVDDEGNIKEIEEVPIDAKRNVYRSGYDWVQYSVFLNQFKTYQGDGFRMLELPLADERMSLLILLPETLLGVASVGSLLTEEALASWYGEMKEEWVELRLPHFEVETEAYLSQYDYWHPMRAVGVEDLFIKEASNMRDIYPIDGIYANRFMQRSTFGINSEGVDLEATTWLHLSTPDLSSSVAGTSSVSGVVITIAMGPSYSYDINANGPSIIDFNVDHPFIAVVYDHSADSILGMARVTDIQPSISLGNVGNDWIESTWFGWINAPTKEQWVYHLNHGWIYAGQIEARGSWYYDMELGWVFTTAATYPWIHSTNEGWLYYQKESKSPRWFYSKAVEDWFSVP